MPVAIRMKYLRGAKNNLRLTKLFQGYLDIRAGKLTEKIPVAFSLREVNYVIATYFQSHYSFRYLYCSLNVNYNFQ